MKVYLPPSVTGFTPKRMAFSTWVDHMPFACDLVAALRPRMLVELGVFNGLSYFAFCQAMQEHGISGRCFGIDSWEGEAHTSTYGESVYEEVRSHNDANYSEFSTLVRSYFNKALMQFDDESIDLLHIDGFHTYEAVQDDFRYWYPKVVPGGVVLFHDVRARLLNFGVWRYWDELCHQYPSFTFSHCFGLGVLRKPGGEPSSHPLLQTLFAGSEQAQQDLRRFYVHAALHYELRRKARRRKDGGFPRQ